MNVSQLGATALASPRGAHATSIYTRQQVRSGSTNRHSRRRPRGPVDPLAKLLRDPAQREASKLDLADVLTECGRLAHEDRDVERAFWFDQRAGALRDCALVRVFVHRGCGSGVATPLSCHVRGCPDCERARVARLVDRYDTLAERMDRPVFWTVTTRNVEQGELEAGIRKLRADFGRLRRRAIFAGGPCRWRWPEVGPDGMPDGAPGHPCHIPRPAPDCRSPRCAQGCSARRGETHLPGCEPGCLTRTGRSRSRCLTHPPIEAHAAGCPPECPHAGHRRDRNCETFAHKRVAGGAVACDLTYSEESGTWHPHLHSLMDAPWIGWAEMRDTWQALTCRTRHCRHGRSSRCSGSWSVWVEAVSVDDPEVRRGAVREVLKYVGKPHGIIDSLDPERIGEYVWATRRQKLVSGFGSLYRVQVEETEPTRADQILIHGLGFAEYHVPHICPNCGVATREDDWGYPMVRSRLDAHRLPLGGYAWNPTTEGRTA